MKFLYGYDDSHYININTIVFSKCMKDTGIIIPRGDLERCELVGFDPYPQILKHICVINGSKKYIIPHNREFRLNWPSISDQLDLFNNLKKWWDTYGKNLPTVDEKLSGIHSHTNFNYGDMKSEYVEQMMAMTFLNENSKVLELGGNTGRNTIVISTILNNPKNLVVFESDPEIAKQLKTNLENNNINTNVEACALSQNRLIQQSWNTLPIGRNDPIPEGWKEIASMTWTELNNKYGIQFDTLVADCEGALYYILKDEPHILDNFKLLIMENDYMDADHKLFVDTIMKMKGFRCVFTQGGGWGPCADNFWEVWKKY